MSAVVVCLSGCPRSRFGLSAVCLSVQLSGFLFFPGGGIAALGARLSAVRCRCPIVRLSRPFEHAVRHIFAACERGDGVLLRAAAPSPSQPAGACGLSASRLAAPAQHTGTSACSLRRRAAAMLIASCVCVVGLVGEGGECACLECTGAGGRGGGDLAHTYRVM